jgi:ABC-2 type transport system permease protein
MIRSIHALVIRELKRFMRQKGRFMATIATPLGFWVLFGAGYGSLFEETFLQSRSTVYFFPGVLLLTLLFASIFSMISVIEDRQEGFLQGVLIIPQAGKRIVLGKIAGTVCMALLQTLFIMAMAWWVPIVAPWTSWVAIVFVLVLISIWLSAISFFFAWWLDSSQGFHGVMNLVLFPMWLLSGAFFPIESAHGWMQVLMKLNPLHYGLRLIRHWLEPAFVQQPFALTGSESAILLGLLLLCGVSVWGCIALVQRTTQTS